MMDINHELFDLYISYYIYIYIYSKLKNFIWIKSLKLIKNLKPCDMPIAAPREVYTFIKVSTSPGSYWPRKLGTVFYKSHLSERQIALIALTWCTATFQLNITFFFFLVVDIFYV